MAVAWKTIGEMKEMYSEAELAFEKRKQFTGLLLGPLLFLILILIPTPAGMTRPGQVVMAMIVWTVVWWVTEAIPIPATAFIPYIMLVVTGIMQPAQVFAVLGDSQTFLMIGAFIIVQAMISQGLAKRFALTALSSSWIGTSPNRLVFAFLGATALLSAVMSNIPVTMLYLAIGLGMVEFLKVRPEGNLGKTLTLASAYGAQAGGLMTPIGATAPNFLMVGLVFSLLGYRIRFGDWMVWGVPFAIVTFLVMLIYLRLVLKPEMSELGGVVEFAKDELRRLGPMSRGEKYALSILGVALFLWLVPSIVAAIYGQQDPTTKFFDMALNQGAVAIACALGLFLLPTNWKDRQFVMNWGEAARGVEWGVIVLISAGLLIGQAMNQPGVDLMKYIASGLAGPLNGAPPLLAVLGLTAIAVILTQFVSNVAAIALLVPIVVPVAIAVGANPVAVALTVGIACQQSYSLPISCPSMAVAYGGGNVKMTEMIRYGSVLSAILIPVTGIVMYLFTSVLYPYAGK